LTSISQVCSLKFFGKKHIDEMAECMQKSRKVCDLIAGFDMVNEEDTTPPMKEFLDSLLKARETLNDDCPFYFHGKSYSL
jgi:hypothetical protein